MDSPLVNLPISYFKTVDHCHPLSHDDGFLMASPALRRTLEHYPQNDQGTGPQVANDYRFIKKTKLQRTFVSASDAAEDRARGLKREGGIIIDGPPNKSNKIQFVKPGQVNQSEAKSDEEIVEDASRETVPCTKSEAGQETTKSEVVQETTKSDAVVVEAKEVERIDYLAELSQFKFIDVRQFRQNMFTTRFGRFVLFVRSWAGKLWNIQSSCQLCGVKLENNYNENNGRFCVSIDGIPVGEASGSTKLLAKKTAGDLAWDVMKKEVVMLLIKEQFITQNDSRISVSEVTGNKPRDDQFGTPVETSVASKMMKLMGWKGGGLGVDAQGIAEPIKPHLQMVKRAGLGSSSSDLRQIKRAVEALMRRYSASDCLDLDLVFSNDFSKDERALLHQVAKNSRLVSRSYGKDAERFLVVRKKLDPFSLVEAVIAKGGSTPKYEVFIPAALDNHSQR